MVTDGQRAEKALMKRQRKATGEPMSRLQITYPITQHVRDALHSFPDIEKIVQLPQEARSSLEIVRVLGNTHCKRVVDFLAFIERTVLDAGQLGRDLLKQNDLFQFYQHLALLFLFSHLQKQLGSAVTAAKAKTISSKTPDISVAWNDLDVRIEVFCPVDFFGFQLVEYYLSHLLIYLDLDRGYQVDVKLGPIDKIEHNSYFTYNFGDETQIRCWLSKLATDVRIWLAGCKEHERRVFEGPSGTTWGAEIRVLALHDDPHNRCVGKSTATHSTDTWWYFEECTLTNTLNSEWGKKLKGKLARRQCGDPTQDRLRVLVVDFSLADAADKDFICRPKVGDRMAEVMQHLAKELGPPIPFDVVLPAQLDFECGFAPGISLNDAAAVEGMRFLESAGLTVPVKAREEIDTAAQVVEFLASCRDETWVALSLGATSPSYERSISLGRQHGGTSKSDDGNLCGS